MNAIRLQFTFEPVIARLTGIPAGRNRSKLCTGIMKQSRSNVDNDIGSFRLPTTILFPLPPKLTARISFRFYRAAHSCLMSRNENMPPHTTNQQQQQQQQMNDNMENTQSNNKNREENIYKVFAFERK